MDLAYQSMTASAADMLQASEVKHQQQQQQTYNSEFNMVATGLQQCMTDLVYLHYFALLRAAFHEGLNSCMACNVHSLLIICTFTNQA